MATGKRYYWIKLKESFMTSDAVDFLMEQPNGANYVVLYQMLCLKTINTEGRLSRQIGEMIIPYDAEKIARDCKWFSVDTVRVAMNLYKSLGLIYVDEDGVLALADHSSLVGSETDWAAQKKRQVEKKAVQAPVSPHTIAESSVESGVENLHTDIRERDKEKEIKSSDIRVKETKKKNDAFSDFASDNEPLLKALRDFEKMRKDIGKPLSDRAKTMVINKLQTFPVQDWIPIIEQSILYDWQGLFPLKENDRSTRTETKGTSAVSNIMNLYTQYGGDENG